MTHFDWEINYLKKYSTHGEFSDIVYEVGYTCVGINTAGILTSKNSYASSHSLSIDGLENPIAYSSLTEDIVMGWINEAKPAIESAVEGNINGADASPITVMPWD